MLSRLVFGTLLSQAFGISVPNAWDSCPERLGFLSQTLGIPVPNAWDSCPKRLGIVGTTALCELLTPCCDETLSLEKCSPIHTHCSILPRKGGSKIDFFFKVQKRDFRAQLCERLIVSCVRGVLPIPMNVAKMLLHPCYMACFMDQYTEDVVPCLSNVANVANFEQNFQFL